MAKGKFICDKCKNVGKKGSFNVDKRLNCG